MNFSDETGTAASLAVNFIRDMAGLDAISKSWTALEPSDEPSFFQSYAWCRHIASVRGSSSSNFSLCVAAVMLGGELQAIWPLSLHRTLGIRIARNLDYPYGQFAGILISEKAAAFEVVDAIVQELDRLRLADAIVIDGTRESSQLYRALRNHRFGSDFTNTAVSIDLRPFSKYRAYETGLHGKSRKNLRNFSNKLNRECGEVQSVVVTNKNALEKVIEDTFDQRLSWLLGRGKMSAAFRDPSFRTATFSLASNSAVELIAFCLQAKGAVIASQWGFIHHNRYYAYISARDANFDRYSPGRLHLSSVVRLCHERGLQQLELMAPAAPYKMAMGTGTTALFTFQYSLTTRGALALRAEDAATRFQKISSRILPVKLKKYLVARIHSG